MNELQADELMISQEYFWIQIGFCYQQILHQ